MPTYTIKGPDGNTYSIDGPAGATRDEVIAKIKSRMQEEPGLLGDAARGLTRGFTGGAATLGRAAQIEMGEPVTAPDPEQAFDIAQKEVTGPLPAPTSTIGKVVEKGAEAIGNPQWAIAPGGILARMGTAALSGAGAELGGEAAEAAGASPTGPVRTASELIGALLAPSGAAGLVSGARAAFTPSAQATNLLARAIQRDGTTPEELLQILERLRRDRPEATLVDAAATLPSRGTNIRGQLERIGQTPGEGAGTVESSMVARQEQQRWRLIDDIQTLTGGDRGHSIRVIDAAKKAREEASGPLYTQAYADGDRAIINPELERLSAVPEIDAAMKQGVRNWQRNQGADRYGAMQPRARVSGGMLEFMKGGGIPVFPNLQFWDYTKRALGDMIAKAAPGSDERRALSKIAEQLRGTLDVEVPSYRVAREAWGGETDFANAVEDGKHLLDRSVSGEEIRFELEGMTDSQREGYLIGTVTAIVDRLKSETADLADFTKFLKSPAMREKLRAVMPSPEAADAWERRLNYEIESTRTVGRAIKGSPTARRLAQEHDRESLAKDLLWSLATHGMHAGLGWPMVMSMLGKANVGGRLRDFVSQEADAALAGVLTSPNPRLEQALGRAATPVPYGTRRASIALQAPGLLSGDPQGPLQQGPLSP